MKNVIEQMRIKVAREQAGKKPCLLCARRPKVVVGWEPGNDEQAARVGQPPGMRRAMFYSLCKRCMRIPEMKRRKRVEDRLATEAMKIVERLNQARREESDAGK